MRFIVRNKANSTPQVSLESQLKLWKLHVDRLRKPDAIELDV